MNVRQLFPGILGFSDILEDPMQCIRDLENAIEKEKVVWHTAEAGANGYGPSLDTRIRSGKDYRLDKTMSESSDEFLANVGEIHAKLTKAMVKPIMEYKNKYGMLIKSQENWCILRYDIGDFFKAHTDGSHEYPRQLSMVFYFNDNYEGGELYFPFIDVKIKPLAGELILFPSNYLFAHAANEVTQGTKYAAINFAN